MATLYKKIITLILLILFNNILDIFASTPEFYEMIKSPVCELDSDDWTNKCMKIGDYSNSAMDTCLSKALKACDELLNDVYQQAMEKAKKFDDMCKDGECGDRYDETIKEHGSQQERLKKAELAWIKFKEADSVVDVDFTGRESSIHIGSSNLSATKNRIKQLKTLF
jgi:uncharacterized protein YecT (DUF1311 family)